jgi:2-iminobutanoate/2-iminopropanoate deaminase
MKSERRSLIKKLFASVAGIAGIGAVSKVQAEVAAPAPQKEVGDVEMYQDVPLFSGHTKFNNLVFVAGKGAHFDGDITAHTKHVLDELEKELIKAGSSSRPERLQSHERSLQRTFRQQTTLPHNRGGLRRRTGRLSR